MNGKILLTTPFKEVFIQPAAGDSGTALGACHYIHNMLLNQQRSFVMEHAYTGPEFRDGQVVEALQASQLPYRELSENDLYAAAAKAIAEGKVVGWVQGRMEFGPRALGNRSILTMPQPIKERIKRLRDEMAKLDKATHVYLSNPKSL